MVLTAFGVLGLCIAAMGLYSVFAYGVTQRTREIGVRLAIGARSASVQRVVLASGMRLTLVGVLLGIAFVLLTGRWLQGLLFEVRPADPLVMVPVAGVLLASAAAASLIPAWRAARVDPAVALRAE